MVQHRDELREDHSLHGVIVHAFPNTGCMNWGTSSANGTSVNFLSCKRDVVFLIYSFYLGIIKEKNIDINNSWSPFFSSHSAHLLFNLQNFIQHLFGESMSLLRVWPDLKMQADLLFPRICFCTLMTSAPLTRCVVESPHMRQEDAPSCFPHWYPTITKSCAWDFLQTYWNYQELTTVFRVKQKPLIPFALILWIAVSTGLIPDILCNLYAGDFSNKNHVIRLWYNYWCISSVVHEFTH